MTADDPLSGVVSSMHGPAREKAPHGAGLRARDRHHATHGADFRLSRASGPVGRSRRIVDH
jgi:hypothetical protein